MKESLVPFCETITCGTMSPCPDLSPLRSHETTLPVSLKSFDEDIVLGIKQTSHDRYYDWFTKSFRGVKPVPSAEEGTEPVKP